MSEEIQQAVQIIRVAYDGIEISMKLGSASLNQLKKAVDFLGALLDQEKAMGKTSMRKLLLKGGDLQVFQFDTEDLKQNTSVAGGENLFSPAAARSRISYKQLTKQSDNRNIKKQFLANSG